MKSTDQLLARLVAEIEERQQFIDGVVEAAEKDARDLSPQEMELVTRARTRMGELNEQVAPLKETRRIGVESRQQLAELAKFMGEKQDEKPRVIEYRSAGHYVSDYIQAVTGTSTAAKERLEVFMRAAAHQTTPDNPGLLPEQILGPVVNYIDAARPIVSILGPRQLPAGAWSRPRVTQHTDVAAQTAEKTELVSRKMIISKIPVTATTYGGYVNVSRQNIDWSQPAIMDMVINDLAGQYAVETELATATTLAAGATAGGTLPATPTSADVAAALWAAAGSAFAAVQGQGRLVAAVSPDVLGLLGPMFAPVNPADSQSPGFTASNFGSGVMGTIGGIAVVMSSALPAKSFLVLSTAAAEAYEDRIGSLQVVEPSVLGVQVAYAGYFAVLIIEAAGVIKIAVT
jgi:HK97 family phage major capsid protein